MDPIRHSIGKPAVPPEIPKSSENGKKEREISLQNAGAPRATPPPVGRIDVTLFDFGQSENLEVDIKHLESDVNEIDRCLSAAENLDISSGISLEKMLEAHQPKIVDSISTRFQAGETFEKISNISNAIDKTLKVTDVYILKAEGEPLGQSMLLMISWIS